MKIDKKFVLSILLIVPLSALIAQSTAGIDANTFGEIKARHVGPATMSGRIAALDASNLDPRLLYVGAASGGLWKSVNGGVTFKPVFDKYNQSIGAVAIDQERTDTVWVGTGESWVRNSVSVGDGIYKTTDGGGNWKKMGLDSSERIARIIIHPSNPDIVFVAALGHLWSGNADRGVFRTMDGGQNWEKVLFIDQNTGCSDLTIDPENPDVLYAAMWDFRRKPYTFSSGGPGSGLYKTENGGDSWREVTNGLPSGIKGRISVAISPVDPEMVYALIEAEKDGGLYRSDNSGKSWKLVNKTIPMIERPFYFSQIYPDPVDSGRVYKPSFNLHVSTNKGEKFQLAYVGGGNVHVDHHALWIGKKDNNLLYLGTDGGVYKSIDKGKTWTMIRNLPVSQFYRVSIDMEKPYNVYGGLQDNGSWTAPSSSPGGIENTDWVNVGFGDGFYVFADRNDNDILYWQSQGGNFNRSYRKRGEIKEIKPYGDKSLGDLRWNWNSAIAFSPASNAMYVGAQYLFKSIDRGDSWERISPDLTTNDKSKLIQEKSGGLTIDNSTAENYCTIYSISESPVNSNIIWAGTDDGNLQITRDGGKTWVNVVSNISGLPSNTWCSNVEAGRFDEGTVFVTFDGHRNGDMKPYLYKSEDYGESFNLLSDENIKGYCFDIIQDLVNPELLFLGTEFGLFASIDGGSSWARMEGNIPLVAVHEMVIHPEKNDLIFATHGRGIMIIDDISPLRALKTEYFNQELTFLPSRPYLISSQGIQQKFGGDDEFTGRNPPDGVYISYYLNKRHVFGDMIIEIYDKEGNKVSTLPAGKRKGINRELWVPREKPPKVPVSNNLSAAATQGPVLLPGDYRVVVIKGDKKFESSISILFDPDLPHSEADRELQLKTLHKAYDMLEELAFTDATISKLSTDIKALEERLKKEGKLKGSTGKKLNGYVEKLDKLHESMVATKIGGITGEEQLRERIAGIYGAVIRYYGKPTDSQIERLNTLEKELDTKKEESQKLITELPSINQLIKRTGSTEIEVLSRDKFEEE